jgi:hypothetical protein
MTFWCGSGSGSADPCLWLIYLDPDSDPDADPDQDADADPDQDADPDPSILIIDLQDANKKLLKKKVFLHITF